jgi:hypothetical protein
MFDLNDKQNQQTIILLRLNIHLMELILIKWPSNLKALFLGYTLFTKIQLIISKYKTRYI